MAPGLPNRVRQLRETRGLSQAALCAAVGVSRQSVHAIESGRALPAVDVALRLARALECSVEDVFGDAESEPRLTAESVGDARPGRVSLSHIAGRWLSYSLSRDSVARSADAIAVPATSGRVEVELLRSTADARENLVLMGCAPALGLLADRLNARPGPGRCLWFTQSSTGALGALDRQQTHLAGVHLMDSKTGEANLPDVRRLGSTRSLVLITLASWEVGLLTARGNPKAISKVEQLGRKGLRLVVRESGSGARRLFDQELARAGLPKALAHDAAIQASGQMEVAQAIALGAADAGVATRDAALAFDLGFVPLTQERYDLVVARDDLTDSRLVRLFEVMSSASFRRELAVLGYDVQQCDERVAEVQAA